MANKVALKGKTEIKIALFLVIGLFSVLPFGASAEVLLSQTVGDEWEQLTSYDAWTYKIYTDTLEASDHLFSLVLKTHINSGSGTMKTTLSCWTGTATSTMESTDQMPVGTTPENVQVTWTSGTTGYWNGTGIPVSDCIYDYALLTIWNGGGSEPFYYGSKTDQTSIGRFMIDDDLYYDAPHELEDLYFILGEVESDVLYGNNYAVFTAPEDNATSTSPITISVEGRLDSDDFDYPLEDLEMVVEIMKLYNATSTVWQTYEYLVTAYDEIMTHTISYPITSTGAYQAKVYFINNELSSTLWPSDIVNFGGSATYPVNIPPGNKVQAQIEAQEYCEGLSTAGGFWNTLTAGSLCRVGIYLFKPTVPLSDNLKLWGDMFTPRFPFSLVVQLSNAIDTLNLATTTSPDITYTPPTFNGTRATGSVKIFDEDTYQSHSVLDTIRQDLVYIIYFLAGFWLFYRVTNLL